MNDRHCTMFAYRTCSLSNKYQVYDEQVAKNVLKCASRLPVPMKSLQLDPVDHMSVICFLSAFKMAWKDNAIHEGAMM